MLGKPSHVCTCATRALLGLVIWPQTDDGHTQSLLALPTRRNLIKSPGGERVLQLSTDGGASWGPSWTHPVLRGPRNPWFMPAGCHGSMVSLRRGRMLIFAGPDTSGEERLNVSLIGSTDGGRSWLLMARVHEGPSAYASLARLPATRGGRPQVGILYEGGRRGEHYAKRIDFVRWAIL